MHGLTLYLFNIMEENNGDERGAGRLGKGCTYEKEVRITNLRYADDIHSLSHFGYFFSALSSPLLLRGAPDYSIDTVSDLTHAPKRYRNWE